MSRFRFDLACVDDDKQLRALLHRIEMPGRIGLKLLREPSFFAGNDLSGGLHQTIACRDGNDGTIVGFGCRSVRDLHTADGRRPVGYLHMLRSEPRVRSGLLLARGYRFLRHLHDDGQAATYLTTIAEGNHVARETLTSGRGGLPRYEPRGDYTTVAVAGRRRRPQPTSDFTISTADEVGLEPVLSFVDDQACRYRFLPCYEAADFGPEAATFKGLPLGDVLVALDRRDRVVGTLGLWDQRPFRQTVVSAYDRLLTAVRPLVNLRARLVGGIALPPVGSTLDYATAAIPLAAAGRADVLDGLMARAQAIAHDRGLGYILVGLHRHDPFWPTVRRRASQHYNTTLYRVGWDPIPAPTDDDTVPYLELGVL